MIIFDITDEPMSQHPVIKFLGTLPQFHLDAMAEAVVHLRFGTVVTAVKSEEPKYRSSLNLYWPGQNREERCLVEMGKYVNLQIYDAVEIYGTDEAESITNAGQAAVQEALATPL